MSHLEDECCSKLEVKFDKIEIHIAQIQEVIENKELDECVQSDHWVEGE